MTSAIVCLLFTLVVFTTAQLPWAAGAFAGTAWCLEALRRRSEAWNDRLMAFFGSIARTDERTRVNSGTWYMTALVVLALTYSPILCVVGVSVLGFADPAAAFIGRRFGRIRLSHGRSLEGSLAFVAVGTMAAFVTMQLLPHTVDNAMAWSIAAAAAFGGAVAELVSGRVDDNFTIPLAAAATAAGMLALYGASPW